MLFQVVKSQTNQIMMSTTSVFCIPFKYLDSMNRSGYYFKLDGKRISLKDVKAMNMTSDAIIETKSTQTSKYVRCIDTGEIFKTQSEAARRFNIDPAQVSDSIKTGRPRSGYTFERCQQE